MCFRVFSFVRDDSLRKLFSGLLAKQVQGEGQRSAWVRRTGL